MNRTGVFTICGAITRRWPDDERWLLLTSCTCCQLETDPEEAHARIVNIEKKKRPTIRPGEMNKQRARTTVPALTPTGVVGRRNGRQGNGRTREQDGQSPPFRGRLARAFHKSTDDDCRRSCSGSHGRAHNDKCRYQVT